MANTYIVDRFKKFHLRLDGTEPYQATEYTSIWTKKGTNVGGIVTYEIDYLTRTITFLLLGKESVTRTSHVTSTSMRGESVTSIGGVPIDWEFKETEERKWEETSYSFPLTDDIVLSKFEDVVVHPRSYRTDIANPYTTVLIGSDDMSVAVWSAGLQRWFRNNKVASGKTVPFASSLSERQKKMADLQGLRIQ